MSSALYSLTLLNGFCLQSNQRNERIVSSMNGENFATLVKKNDNNFTTNIPSSSMWLGVKSIVSNLLLPVLDKPNSWKSFFCYFGWRPWLCSETYKKAKLVECIQTFLWSLWPSLWHQDFLLFDKELQKHLRLLQANSIKSSQNPLSWLDVRDLRCFFLVHT